MDTEEPVGMVACAGCWVTIASFGENSDDPGSLFGIARFVAPIRPGRAICPAPLGSFVPFNRHADHFISGSGTGTPPMNLRPSLRVLPLALVVICAASL